MLERDKHATFTCVSSYKLQDVPKLRVVRGEDETRGGKGDDACTAYTQYSIGPIAPLLDHLNIKVPSTYT